MDKKAMVEALIAYYTDGNKAQFAKMLGISPQTVSAWVTRKTFDSELIYAKCRYINASWLLTGEGDMLKTSPSDSPDSSHQSSATSPSQEKEPRGKRGKVAQDTTDPSVAELARIITEQAKELARQSKEITDQAREIAQRDVEIIQLKEQVRQLTIEKARDADDAPSQAIAHAG